MTVVEESQVREILVRLAVMESKLDTFLQGQGRLDARQDKFEERLAKVERDSNGFVTLKMVWTAVTAAGASGGGLALVIARLYGGA